MLIALNDKTKDELIEMAQSTRRYLDHLSEMWVANTTIYFSGECTTDEFEVAKQQLCHKVQRAEERLSTIEYMLDRP